jgi:hypothetical protein
MSADIRQILVGLGRHARGMSAPPLFVPAAAGVRKEIVMTVERALRLIAGFFVMLSVLLGMFIHTNFLWFTLFVGVNLFQSAFTNWCPMMSILRRTGVSA